MRKTWGIVLLLFLLLILAACDMDTTITNTEAGENQNTPNREELATIESAGHTRQEILCTAVAKESLSFKKGEMVSFPEVGLHNVFVGERIETALTGFGQKTLYVYLLNDYPYEEKWYHYAYMAVEIGKEVLVCDLKIGSYEDKVYSCDVDGDGCDEILLHQAVGFTGGAGQFVSRVFKVRENALYEIFNSQVDVLSGEERQYDTGFRSEFEKDRKLKVTNSITGYCSVIDISQKYTDEFFDENGKGLLELSIECDSFFEFQPKDLNGDGVYEIECLQYVSLLGHADGVGYAKSILKYSEKKKDFFIVESCFLTEHSDLFLS